MTLYEINTQLAALLADAIDPETGEIPEDVDLWAELDRLNMYHDDVLEQMALDYKNRTAEAEACRKEAKTLLERARRQEAVADTIKAQLAFELNGQKFSTGRVSMNWRKSKTTEITDKAAFLDFAENGHDHLLKYREPEPDKTAIYNAMRGGVSIPGVEIIEHNNMSIK